MENTRLSKSSECELSASAAMDRTTFGPGIEAESHHAVTRNQIAGETAVRVIGRRTVLDKTIMLDTAISNNISIPTGPLQGDTLQLSPGAAAAARVASRHDGTSKG